MSQAGDGMRDDTGQARQRHAQLKRAFDTLLDLPAAERAVWLDAFASESPELLEPLKALLANAGESTGFLSGRADQWLEAGREVGRGWRIVRELDRGGMGVVYLAERADGEYRMQAALKLLAASSQTQSGELERLRSERQILARLQHPYIARLLDGGSTTEGLPFIVMEYVQGERLDRWCQKRALALDARLALFQRVCEAVAYAHRNLVVHRDLKPSNILVREDGEPRLLDFGIAKLLDAGDSEATRLSGPLMTPRYASPEQIAGEPVTTLTDVYSLGVILYELVAGESPYGDALSSPEQLISAIRSGEFTPPSRITGRQDVDFAEASAPAVLVDADLDAIVLKALRREPLSRYPGVDALAEDIARYRAGLPVLAHRGSLAYRMRKTLRRHWLAAGLAAVACAVALAFTIGLALQLEATREQRDRAERTAEFLEALFAAADPSRTRGAEVTAREMLERGALRIRSDDTLSPEVRAQLALSMSRAFMSLGAFDPAAALLSQARSEPGSHEREILAQIATLEIERGALEAAQSAFDAYATANGAGVPRDAVQAKVLHDRGWLAMKQGNMPEARAQLDLALALRTQLFGARSLEVAEALNTRANILRQSGDMAGAERDFRESLSIAESLGENPWLQARLRNNLAVLHVTRGEVLEALAELERVDTLFVQVLGPAHPLTLTARGNRASLMTRVGQCARAVELQSSVRDGRIALFGAHDAQTALARSNLGYTYFCASDTESARAELDTALADLRAALGDAHPNTASTRRSLALLDYVQGDCDSALAGLDAVLSARATLGELSPLVINARSRRALVLSCLGRDGAAQEATAALEQARALPPAASELREAILIASLFAANACKDVDAAVQPYRAELPEADADRAFAESVLGHCNGVSPSAAQRDALLHRYSASHPIWALLAPTDSRQEP